MHAFLMTLAAVLVCPHLQAAEGSGLSRQQIEKDLVLQIARTSPATIQVGEQVDVAMVVRNQSATTSYPLVAPGDGSDAGWREPYVYFTATLDTGDGVSKPVPAAHYSRCGNFDPDWVKDSRVLKPGEQLSLKGWIPWPSELLEFQESGRVRLVAHYRYGAGVTARGAYPKVVTGPLAGVPAFELVSAPVEFDVVRPLDLVLTVKAPLPVKARAKVSDLFDIRLVNRSGQPIEVPSSTISAADHLAFEIEGKYPGWRPLLKSQKSTSGDKIILKPNEEVALLGAGSLANGLDGTWEYPVPDTLKVRARFYISLGSGILSKWVEIKAIETKDNVR